MLLRSALPRWTRALLPSLLGALALASCGNGPYQVVEKKEYQLHILTDDATVKAAFQSIITSYNSRVGFAAITYAPAAEKANSIVLFTRGLTDRDGKVGWGQWLVESEDESVLTLAQGRRPVREMDYSLRMELDEEYVQERVRSTDAKAKQDLWKLFCHEIGHGFKLDHIEDNPSDMMYPDISGTKNEDAYFAQVRRFFGR